MSAVLRNALLPHSDVPWQMNLPVRKGSLLLIWRFVFIISLLDCDISGHGFLGLTCGLFSESSVCVMLIFENYIIDLFDIFVCLFV